jgi:general secretion pathway protein L
LKPALRIALPPLRALAPDARVAFVLLDRERRIMRAGELPLRDIAPAMPAARVEAVLHPRDTVDTRIALPPLRGERLLAAAIASVEPLTLSATEELAIACGPREPDGRAPVAWTDRTALARAWDTLAQAGLDVVAFYPTQALLPEADAEPTMPLSLPADARWQQPAPPWSLALAELRPAAQGGRRWRASLAWGAAALAVWLGGLNIYAAQLAAEGAALQQSIHDRVALAFPELPVIIDPLKQAGQRLDALRAARGASSDGDFMQLALAATRLLPSERLQLSALSYREGVLSIDVDTSRAAAPTVDSAAQRQAGTPGLRLDATDTGWKIAPAPLANRSDAPDRARNTPGRQP